MENSRALFWRVRFCAKDRSHRVCGRQSRGKIIYTPFFAHSRTRIHSHHCAPDVHVSSLTFLHFPSSSDSTKPPLVLPFYLTHIARIHKIQNSTPKHPCEPYGELARLCMCLLTNLSKLPFKTLSKLKTNDERAKNRSVLSRPVVKTSLRLQGSRT